MVDADTAKIYSIALKGLTPSPRSIRMPQLPQMHVHALAGMNENDKDKAPGAKSEQLFMRETDEKGDSGKLERNSTHSPHAKEVVGENVFTVQCST